MIWGIHYFIQNKWPKLLSPLCVFQTRWSYSWRSPGWWRIGCCRCCTRAPGPRSPATRRTASRQRSSRPTCWSCSSRGTAAWRPCMTAAPARCTSSPSTGSSPPGSTSGCAAPLQSETSPETVGVLLIFARFEVGIGAAIHNSKQIKIS